jgi:uncharacterized tellurite resistance protein B-like protein
MANDPLLESLEALVRGEAATPEPDAQQIRAAVAVLLVDVVLADGQIRHDEHRSLGHALQRVLGLSEEQADTLVRGERGVSNRLSTTSTAGPFMGSPGGTTLRGAT